jgi:hypothetical protein
MKSQDPGGSRVDQFHPRGIASKGFQRHPALDQVLIRDRLPQIRSRTLQKGERIVTNRFHECNEGTVV